MTPSTSIMNEIVRHSNQFNIIVEQAEDEIAAINMAIGASFAGVRSMTATSGGGFCLMVEGVSLAAMTETPVVIVNAQGLPRLQDFLPGQNRQIFFLCFLPAMENLPRLVLPPVPLKKHLILPDTRLIWPKNIRYLYLL
jgi:2-oxoglutarate ferredoxin oxidoreductase subunit alpha